MTPFYVNFTYRRMLLLLSIYGDHAAESFVLLVKPTQRASADGHELVTTARAREDIIYRGKGIMTQRLRLHSS